MDTRLSYCCHERTTRERRRLNPKSGTSGRLGIIGPESVCLLAGDKDDPVCWSSPCRLTLTYLVFSTEGSDRSGASAMTLALISSSFNVSRGSPVIKAAVCRCRLFARMRRHAKMPLAQAHGFVAVALQHLRQRDFLCQQMRVLVVVVNPTVDAGAQVLSSAQ